MRQLATRQGASAIVAALVWLALVAGSCQKAEPGQIRPGNVVPEDEDEQALTQPQNLGGPGHGKASLNPKLRPTPFLRDFVENLTDAELVAYLSQLQYDMGPGQSQTVRAACVHNPTGNPHPIPAPRRCNVGDGAEVAIEPEVGMHMIDFAAIPEHGLVVARIINYDKGDREEATFGFPPGRRVWWVVDRPNGVIRSRFFIRNYRATAPAVTQIRDVAAVYTLVNCHPTETHPHAQATFATCSRAPHLTAPARGSAARPSITPVAGLSFAGRAPLTSSVPMPALVETVIDGTWVTCRGGCCATSP
jgi:hypothetical protein